MKAVVNLLVMVLVAVTVISGNVYAESVSVSEVVNVSESVRTGVYLPLVVSDVSAADFCYVDFDFHWEIVGFNGYNDIQLLMAAMDHANYNAYTVGNECFLTFQEYEALVEFAYGRMSINELLERYPRFVDPVYGYDTQLPFVDELFYW